MPFRVSPALAAIFVLVAAAAHGAPPHPAKRGRIAPPAHSVSRDVYRDLGRRLVAGTLGTRAKTTADSLRLVAVRIDFPDLAFGASPPADELHDRFYYETQFAYVSQYFRAASFGALTLHVDVASVVARAPQPQAAYGDVAAYDSLMVSLAGVAVAAADSVVDFSRYDGLVLVHAGPGQESDLAGDSPTQIWSGFLDATTFREVLSTPDSVAVGLPTGDGVQVTNTVVLPEWEVQDLPAGGGGARLGSLGVYAHEIGQRLGLVPLFDASPGSFPDSQGIGNFDVMGYGLWVANGLIPSLPSAFNRVLAGWVRPLEIHAAGDVVLRDTERGPPDSTVARVWISSREYFLVSYVLEDPDGPQTRECDGRTETRRFFEFDDRNANCRFDHEDVNGDSVLSAGDVIDTYAGAEWDFFMTDLLGEGGAGEGSGLLVLHVDEQVLQDVLATGSTNVQGDPRRKAVDVEEADGIEDLDRIADNPRAFGSAGDYFAPGQAFGPATLPDSRSADGAPTGWSVVLAERPDSTAATPGGRARVRFGRAAAAPESPGFVARRVLGGESGADLVALGLGDGRSALVVPADSGRVYLVDAALDEAPVADGDPRTLVPWVQIPPAWSGAWVGAPAVGDVDGDGSPDVVLAASVDSAGAPVARLFGWRRDGTELRDLDGNPGTNTGLLLAIAGRPAPPALFDFDGDGGAEIILALESSPAETQTLFLRSPAGSAWETQASALAPGRLAGGPIVLRWPGGPGHAAAWATTDSAAGATRVHFFTWPSTTPAALGCLEMPMAAGAVRLAAGNTDGVGGDELVVALQDGRIHVVGVDAALDDCTATGPGAATGTGSVSPLALADLDRDGTLEIVFATDTELVALSSTGAPMPGWPYPFRLEPAQERVPSPGRGAGSPLVADLDGDGGPEVLQHLPGGATFVWTSRGVRRPDLEAALPGIAAGTPLLADLDAAPGVELAAVGRFATTVGFDAVAESLLVLLQSELAVWSFARAAGIAWGEWGGGPGHTFHDGLVRPVRSSPNDPSLGGFVVRPNPASREARATIALTADATVRCKVFTLEGETVREASAAGTAGSVVEVRLDLVGLAPGVYLAQLELSTGGRRTRPFAVRR